MVLPVVDERDETVLVGYIKKRIRWPHQRYPLGCRHEIGFEKGRGRKDGHEIGSEADYVIEMKIKTLWTESYVHFTTVEFVTKMEIQVILSKEGMTAYDSVKTVTTSSKSAIMSKPKRVRLLAMSSLNSSRTYPET